MIFFLLRFFYYHLQQFHSQSVFAAIQHQNFSGKIFLHFCILFRRILKNFFEDPVCIYKKIFPFLLSIMFFWHRTGTMRNVFGNERQCPCMVRRFFFCKLYDPISIMTVTDFQIIMKMHIIHSINSFPFFTGQNKQRKIL